LPHRVFASTTQWSAPIGWQNLLGCSALIPIASAAPVTATFRLHFARLLGLNVGLAPRSAPLGHHSPALGRHFTVLGLRSLTFDNGSRTQAVDFKRQGHPALSLAHCWHFRQCQASPQWPERQPAGQQRARSSLCCLLT
jgi:hypothetical protein